jgi:iron complex outermembrane receptor protein
MRGKLSLSVSVLALVCCNAAAQAQTQSSDNSGGVETVVVTAERRATDLQKTAISATVLTGDALQNKGVNVVDQLQFITSSVVIDNFGQGNDFDIRGIATFPGYITEEPYYDVQDVQVLRGPQGTFAGQNAIGGAVFVDTNNPVIGGGYDGYIQAQAGNYFDFGLQGAVNLPIDDELAARVAFYGENRSSFYDITTPTGGKYNGNPGDLHWGAARLSLMWKPTERLTVLWKTDVDMLDNGAYPADPESDRFKYIPGTTTPNPYYAPDMFKIHAVAAQMGQDEFIRSSVKVDYILPDDIKLQSITAYQFGNTSYKADLYGATTQTTLNPSDQWYSFVAPGNLSNDTYAFVDSVDETIWSEEINLISSDKNDFRWIVGGFAQSDTYSYLAPQSQNFVISVPGPGVPSGTVGTVYTLQGQNPETDLSIFGQVSYELPAGFEVQLGGRYAATSTVNKNVLINEYGTPLVSNNGAASHNFSYKAALNWNIDADNFLYGFIATGFKPGGLNVNQGFNFTFPPFGPETVTNYEAGWKSSFFDGHVHTQIDGYYNNFKDFQVTIGNPIFPDSIFTIETNDPHPTKIYGFEGSAQAVFGDLSFDTNIGLMHSELGAFYATDGRLQGFGIPCDPVTGPANAFGTCVNLKGKQQTYAPNFTFNVGVQYNFNLEGGDVLTPRVNYGYVGPQWATLFENATLGDRLSERNILNAQLAWTHGNYTVTLYGTNLINDQYVAALNSGLDFAGPPRQYGIRIMKTF